MQCERLVAHRVLINDEILDFLGYVGQTYKNKKNSITKLLKKNSEVRYEEVPDERDPRKKYYVLNSIDFEALIMQMRTEKVVELRHMYSRMKFVISRYTEYEKYYAQQQRELLQMQNTQLINSVIELKELILSIKYSADEERRLADDERSQTILREHLAQQERQRAEEERQRAEERELEARRRNEVMKGMMQINVYVLRKIAPNVNQGKVLVSGLYATLVPNEYYTTCRQLDGYRDAERRLVQRGMRCIEHFRGISTSVDVIGAFKETFGDEFECFHRKNTIRAKRPITDEELVQMMKSILYKDNEAHLLARMNEHFL